MRYCTHYATQWMRHAVLCNPYSLHRTFEMCTLMFLKYIHRSCMSYCKFQTACFSIMANGFTEMSEIFPSGLAVHNRRRATYSTTALPECVRTSYKQRSRSPAELQATDTSCSLRFHDQTMAIKPAPHFTQTNLLARSEPLSARQFKVFIL